MSILSAIVGFFQAAPKVVDDVFDKDAGLLTKAGGFINDLSYTDAEKAKGYIDLCKAVSDHVASTLSESTVRSVTRRSIAVLWVKVQLALVLMTAIYIPFDKTVAKSFYELATCDVMFWGTGSIVVFFFGAYAWGAHISKGKK